MVTGIRLDEVTRSPSGPTRAYLLGGDLLVDPAARNDELDAAVAEADPSHVAVTHHHPDHTGAVADYAEELDATVWARTGREDAFAAATGVTPDRIFAEGTTIPAGDGVVVRDTPGHAPEHVAFEVPDGLVTGDLAVAEGSVVVGAPSGDMRAYVGSLRRVHAMDPERVFPAHGEIIDDGRATCRRLIDHRLDRERRVLEAVREGAADPSTIVDLAYDKDVSAVRELAESTVRAHLEKLAVEGALEWDGARARID